MKVDIYDIKGKKSKKIEIPNKIFKAKVNKDLITQAVYVYNLNQRSGTSKTKSISEVRGGGRKPWAQKSPDRARVGSIRSPIWVGGGRTFPVSPKDYSKKLSKKMRKRALWSILTLKLNNGELMVLEKPVIKGEKISSKCREIINALPIKGKKVTIVRGKGDEIVHRGFKNLKNVSVIVPENINVFEIINSDTIILLESSISEITNIWDAKDNN